MGANLTKVAYCEGLLPDKFTDHGFVGPSVTFWSLNLSSMVVVLIVGHCKVRKWSAI